ncbi:UNVERIFIED_CONTAM: hypothetical protein K2H54_027507 [Gekko kuhli]
MGRGCMSGMERREEVVVSSSLELSMREMKERKSAAAVFSSLTEDDTGPLATLHRGFCSAWASIPQAGQQPPWSISERPAPPSTPRTLRPKGCAACKVVVKPMEKIKGKTVDKPKEVIKSGSQAASSGGKEADQLNPRGKPPSEQPTEEASVGYNFLNILKMVGKTYYCLLTWTWGTINNFLYKCSGVNAPALTEEPVLSLIDAGLAINTAYPLVLHPERNVKLILSFDFSSGDPFETLKRTVDYCKTQRIPFPRIDEKELNDTENPRDCYIFRGDNGLTVMHFPLFNKVNCPGKIKEYSDQFSTFKKNYSPEEIEKLIIAAKKNVINVRQKILEEIKHTMDS